MLCRGRCKRDQSTINEPNTLLEERIHSNVSIGLIAFRGIGQLQVLLLELKEHIQTLVCIVINASSCGWLDISDAPGNCLKNQDITKRAYQQTRRAWPWLDSHHHLQIVPGWLERLTVAIGLGPGGNFSCCGRSCRVLLGVGVDWTQFWACVPI